MSQAAWFKLFGRHQAMFDALSNEQAGQVIKAALTYLNTGELVDMDPIALVAFSALKADIDRSIADYQEVCKRNKENRHKGLEKGKNVPPSLYDDSDDYETRRAKARVALLGNRPP